MPGNGSQAKLTGAKPPLRPEHAWSIRTKLQIEGRARDPTMFNPAIDSKLRGVMSSPSGWRMSLSNVRFVPQSAMCHWQTFKSQRAHHHAYLTVPLPA